jgi:hypothetical protein
LNQRRSEERERSKKDHDDRMLRRGKEQEFSANERSLENLRLENFALSEAVKMEAQLLKQARLMSSGGRSRSPESKKPRMTDAVVADKNYIKPSLINPSLREKFGSRLSNFLVPDSNPRTPSELRALEDKALEEALKMDAILMEQAALQKQDRSYFSRPSGNRDPLPRRVIEDRALNEANRLREILKNEENRLPHSNPAER